MYTKIFNQENQARSFCAMKNQTTVKSGKFTIYCLVSGPANNFAVVDLKTAMDLGNGYEVL